MSSRNSDSRQHISRAASPSVIPYTAPSAPRHLSSPEPSTPPVNHRLSYIIPAAPAYSEEGISLAALKDWAADVQRDPVSRLAQTVLSKVPMKGVLMKRQTMIEDQQAITMEGSPVANQRNSGRCWLFATTNVIRTFVARKYRLDSFQLSQSYLFFYDHLSKANWFLEQMLDLAAERLDSRVVQHMLANAEAQDGGQYDMAVALIETFGLVPQTVYPESWNSFDSAQVDGLISSKLRENALELRKRYEELIKRDTHEGALRKLHMVKDDPLKEIYRILAITVGTPPHPNEKFVWEYLDKDRKAHRLVSTPLDFAASAGYDASATVSLVNDPRHKYHTLITVGRLGNVVGGRPLRYINVSVEELKEVAISVLEANIPAWFGCDVEKASSMDLGIMDTALYNYNDAFGTTLGLNKADRLRTGDSSMTHAMMLTAVHLDPKGKSVRWRVENSWGPNACTKGFLVMSDNWFDENVFQVSVPRKFVDPKLLGMYDEGKKILSLPPWDPMGALA